jgi:hypothetical protein
MELSGSDQGHQFFELPWGSHSALRPQLYQRHHQDPNTGTARTGEEAKPNARINRRVGKGSTFAILPEKPRQRGEMQFGRHHCYRLITIAGFAVFPSGLKQTW